MANDIILNPGSGGKTVASDQVGLLNGSVSSGIDVPRYKIMQGDPGTARDVSAANPLPVTTNTKITFRASTTALLVTATTVTVPWFVIYGSATKTLKIQSVLVSGVSLTAVAYMNMGCGKYSTTPSGGTSSALTKVSLDSTTAASTATNVLVYTVGPTSGTKVGDISCRRQMGQATTAAAAGIPEEIKFDFSDGKDGGTPVLRGTTEGLGLYWITAPASTPSLLLRIEWTEE